MQNKVQKILCNTLDGKLLIYIDKIRIIEADGNNSYITCDREKTFVTEPMKKLQDLLEEYGFCRIHKSYLVNVMHVRKIINRQGNYVVLENYNNENGNKMNEKKYPLSESGKLALKEAITRYCKM